MRLVTASLLALFVASAGCGSSTTLPTDGADPDASSGEDLGVVPAELRAGVVYDDCGPADGPAIRGLVLPTASECDGARTSEVVPRLELYAAGSGPRWTVATDFMTVTYCTADRCEEATAGTIELDPPMGSSTTLQVDLTFPTAGSLTGSYIVELCPGDVLCG